MIKQTGGLPYKNKITALEGREGVVSPGTAYWVCQDPVNMRR